MADIMWVKLFVNTYDNRKIKYIRKLPNGNDIALLWTMFLTLAGRCNAKGMIFLTEQIPYEVEMLASELDFDEAIVEKALEVFEQLDMITIENKFISIVGWEEYQSEDKLAEIREKNNARKRLQRERQKKTLNCDGHGTVTGQSQPCHAIEEDKEEEKEKKENKKEGERKEQCQQVVDMFNSLCPSLNPIITLSDSRKKAIAKGLLTFTMDDFKKCFEMAEHSSFLKGDNPRKWKATFDWLIDDANMGKVIEGNYSSEADDAEADFNAAVERSKKVFAQGKKSSKTAGEDETVKQRMEALKTQFEQ